MDNLQPSEHELFNVCVHDKLFRDVVAKTLGISEDLAVCEMVVFSRAITLPKGFVPDHERGSEHEKVSVLHCHNGRDAMKARNHLEIIEARKAILACAGRIAAGHRYLPA